MKLSDLKDKEKAIIKSLKCNDDLKQRFYSFGIIQGGVVCMNKISLNNNTMVLDVDGTEVAIRIEEAKQIEVEKI